MNGTDEATQSWTEECLTIIEPYRSVVLYTIRSLTTREEDANPNTLLNVVTANRANSFVSYPKATQAT